MFKDSRGTQDKEITTFENRHVLLLPVLSPFVELSWVRYPLSPLLYYAYSLG